MCFLVKIKNNDSSFPLGCSTSIRITHFKRVFLMLFISLPLFFSSIPKSWLSTSSFSLHIFTIASSLKHKHFVINIHLSELHYNRKEIYTPSRNQKPRLSGALSMNYFFTPRNYPILIFKSLSHKLLWYILMRICHLHVCQALSKNVKRWLVVSSNFVKFLSCWLCNIRIRMCN